jgi:hypothetical protein
LYCYVRSWSLGLLISKTGKLNIFAAAHISLLVQFHHIYSYEQFFPERLWPKWLYQFKYLTFIEDVGGPDYNQRGCMITNLRYLTQ